MTPRAALVTGGGLRLGAVIARALSKAGWQPIIHFNRSGAAAKALASELGTFAIQGDLQASGAGATLLAEAREQLGRPLQGLVNSASIFPHDTPETVSEEALLQNFRVNAAAPVMAAKAFHAQAEDGGAIINMLDQKLFNLHADHYSYTLSKMALHGATTMMAMAYAPKVRAVGVAPGYNLPSPGQDQQTFDRLAPTVNPLGRRLKPEDVASTVIFALNNEAMTGQVLLADNGEHLMPRGRDVVFED